MNLPGQKINSDEKYFRWYLLRIGMMHLFFTVASSFFLIIVSISLMGMNSEKETSSFVYYVDSINGNDINNGTSAQTSWKSLSKVNSTTFQPGDKILFKSGSSWSGTLSLQGSGTKDKPIIIDRYSDGAKPLINGNGAPAALQLNNQEYIEINNLALTNDANDEGLRKGISVVVEKINSVFHHFYLKKIDIQNVRGKLGSDIISKSTGGIGFEIKGNNNNSRFEDILIEDCSLTHVDNVGIYIWSELTIHPRDARWEELKCTNVIIRNNRLTDIGKNAMIVRISKSPLIENNIIERAAARFHGNAIVIFGCKDAIIQRNEVFGTKYYGLEGAAYDSDYNSEGTIIQYNYSHDNEGGMVDFCNNPSSKPPRGYNDGTIVRYNVSQNDIFRVFAFDGPVTNSQIYNNTVYIGEKLSPKIVEFDIFGKSPGYASGTLFKNNIFYNLGNSSYVWGESKENLWEYNCFFGNHPETEPQDSHKIISDPLFIEPGAAKTGINSVSVYNLKKNSPCINSGTVIENNGGKDLAGNKIYFGKPDLGAFENIFDNHK